MGVHTQNAKVLAHLKRATLTSVQAFERYRITRLSGRIYDLRKAGYDIASPLVKRGKARVAEYRMAH